MLRFLFISIIVVAASIQSFAQVQERRLEKGKPEDLRGVTKLYVDGEPGQYWLVHLIVDCLREQIPDLIFVTFADDADACFLISEEKVIESDRVSTASPTDAPHERISNTSKLLGRIISLQVPDHPRLVKEIRTGWQFIARGGEKHSTPLLAREFVDIYRKANSDSQPGTPHVPPTVTASPRLMGGRTAAGPEAQAAASPAVNVTEEIGEEDIVRVNTSLVTIHANVVRRDGQPAPSLQREDFSVFEDGVKQDIAVFEPVNRPFTIVLLIDISGSVLPRLKAIAAAGNALVSSLKDDDQIVILTFGSETKEVLPLTKVRDLRRNDKIDLSYGGSTRLYDAVDLVISKYLRRLPGRKAVVMLTDGLDGTVTNGPDGGSYIADSARNLRDAEELDALFYPVQYNTLPAGMSAEDPRRPWEQRSTEYLQALAFKTGGRVYRADTIGDLAPAFASVVEELSRQYSLGYYPRRVSRNGERRMIKVRVTSPDLVVHARDSYLGTSATPKPAVAK